MKAKSKFYEVSLMEETLWHSQALVSRSRVSASSTV